MEPRRPNEEPPDLPEKVLGFVLGFAVVNVWGVGYKLRHEPG